MAEQSKKKCNNNSTHLVQYVCNVYEHKMQINQINERKNWKHKKKVESNVL